MHTLQRSNLSFFINWFPVEILHFRLSIMEYIEKEVLRHIEREKAEVEPRTPHNKFPICMVLSELSRTRPVVLILDYPLESRITQTPLNPKHQESLLNWMQVSWSLSKLPGSAHVKPGWLARAVCLPLRAPDCLLLSSEFALRGAGYLGLVSQHGPDELTRRGTFCWPRRGRDGPSWAFVFPFLLINHCNINQNF